MLNTKAKITTDSKKKGFVLFRKLKTFVNSNAKERAMKALHNSYVELKVAAEKSVKLYVKVMELSECQEWIGGLRSTLVYTVDEVVKRHVKNKANKVL